MKTFFVVLGLAALLVIGLSMWASSRDVSPTFSNKDRYEVIDTGPRGAEIIRDQKNGHCYVISSVAGYGQTSVVAAPAPDAWCNR